MMRPYLLTLILCFGLLNFPAFSENTDGQFEGFPEKPEDRKSIVDDWTPHPLPIHEMQWNAWPKYPYIDIPEFDLAEGTIEELKRLIQQLRDWKHRTDGILEDLLEKLAELEGQNSADQP